LFPADVNCKNNYFLHNTQFTNYRYYIHHLGHFVKLGGANDLFLPVELAANRSTGYHN
jgi:hypothetical protein